MQTIEDMEAVTWVTTDVNKRIEKHYATQKEHSQKRDLPKGTKGSHIKVPKTVLFESSRSDTSTLKKTMKHIKVSKVKKSSPTTTSGSTQWKKKNSKSESNKMSQPMSKST